MMDMGVQRRFSVKADVSSAVPNKLRPVLERLVAGTITEIPDGFRVDGVMDGSGARDLNRMLLTELRRVERRTRLRSTWTVGASTERFFDYVPKGRAH